jgi:hypothetical protein
MRHHVIIGSLVLLLAALPLAGCGDNDNSNGNDNGGGPGGRCGNGVVDQSSEQCDGSDLDGATCASLGFSGGTVTCNGSCRFVTTACTGTSLTPTPVATPTSGEATPTDVAATATAGEPTATATTVTNPTATPTPGGAACSGDESIVVTLSLDSAITSARLDTGYTGSVNLPGTGPDASVKDRVDFAGSGLTVVNDVDQSGDLTDDTLTTSLVGTDVLPAGPFATITFDCVAGQPMPSASDFTCTVVSASNAGTSVTPACSVAVE